MRNAALMDVRDPYAPAPRRWLGPVVALVLAFAAGIALAIYSVTHWQQLARWLRPQSVAAAAQPTPAVSLLPAPLPAPGPDQAMAERIDSVVARLDAIDMRAQEASGDAHRAEGLLVAFAVRRALDRGAPLGFLEGMLRQRFGLSDPPAVAMIVSAAQRPVSLASLQERFEQIGPALDAAPPGQGWWQGLKREAGALFVVHRTDTPTRPVDRLARARRALEAGQVDVAMTEVARLPASPAATEWNATARRYVLARNALDRIETAALLAPPVATAATTP